MKDEWLEDPLAGYRENAPHLFGYPQSTLSEYLRDLERFLAWLVERQEGGEDGAVGRADAGAVGGGAAGGEGGDSDRGSEGDPGGGFGEGSGGDHDAGSAETWGAGSAVDRRTGLSPLGPQLLLLVRREEIEDFIVHLSRLGLQATTINRKIYSLNSFYVWAVHQRLTAVSPLAGVRKLKTPRRIPKFLTFEDVQTLLAYTGSLRRTSTVRGKQVHAMVSLLYYLGLRREELVGVRFEHIEKVTEQEIYLHVFGKGDKQRLLPFPAPAFRAYEGYVRFRPECPAREIFISLKTGRPLSKYDVNNVCDQLVRRVKLSKKLTPHLLRHTFATHLHLKGQPIEHINALLGHESLNTTKIYVHIDAGKLRESVDRLVPVPFPGPNP